MLINQTDDGVILTNAKICATINVNEILEATPFSPHSGEWYETHGDRLDEVKEYWLNVKEEINNL